MKKVIQIPKIRSLNEEYKEMVKKINLKIEPIKPYSLKQNLKNIINYRKNVALRFKYNKFKIKKKNSILLEKSKSQILDSINKNDFRYDVIMSAGTENKNIKEYEDKLMITGMNNKKLEELISEKIKDESFRNQLMKRISEEDQLKNQKFNLQLELSALKNVELMREVEKKNREIESIKSKLEYTQKRLKEREEEAEQERLEQMKLRLEEKNKKEQKEKLIKNKSNENKNKNEEISKNNEVNEKDKIVKAK